MAVAGFFGTLVGALLIGVLNNGLNLLEVSSFYQQVIKGAVILLAVLIDRGNKKSNPVKARRPVPHDGWRAGMTLLKKTHV